MFNKKKFASNIAVSFFFASLFVVGFYIFMENTVSYYVSLINTAAVKGTGEEKTAKYNADEKKLIAYPKFGSKYATLKINSINLELPVYYGDTKKILKLGVGHYNGSYFPGENGTIVYAAHNNSGYFNKLDQVKIDDEIIVETSYGTFKYMAYEMKIVKETDISAFNVSNENEILLLYTCWPINRNVFGRKTQRYIVYAKRIGDNYA